MGESVEVTVDAREPGKVFDAVDRHTDVDDWFVDTLDAGDLHINGVGFERKEIGDYAGALMETGGRQLEKQVAKLQEMYEHSYVLIDGDLVGTDGLSHTKLPPAAIRGSMAKITALGTPVIPCSNTVLLVDMAVRLARKHVEDTELRYLSTGPVDVDRPTAERVYGCLPGVGAEMAATLHAEYPSVAELAGSSADELMAVDGIGEKTAERILAALNGGDS